MPSDNKNKNVYVGHRYVPKIFGVWDKLKTYEGLSIVTWEGTSYTSKKRVPEGTDILNEEYWVVTGNYNAQVENYRAEVKDLKSEVSENETYMLEEFNNINSELEKTIKVVNAKSFGVVGDGVTDDTMAFKNAFDYLSDGDTLYIPEGKYKINHQGENFDVRGVGYNDLYRTSYMTLMNKSNVNIVGDNAKFIVNLDVRTDSLILFSFYGCKNITIEGVEVDFQSYGWSDANVLGYQTWAVIAGFYDFEGEVSENVLIENCKFRINHPDGSYPGESFNDLSGSTRIVGILFYGDWVNKVRNKGFKFLNNYFHDSTARIVWTYFSENILFENNQFINCGGHPILRILAGCKDIKILNNILESRKDVGTYMILVDSQVTDYLTENVLISGNRIKSNRGTLILVRDVENVIISDNILIKNDGVELHFNGVEVQSTIKASRYITISNNIIKNISRGILLRPFLNEEKIPIKNISIFDNKIYGASIVGINLEYLLDSVISNNILSENENGLIVNDHTVNLKVSNNEILNTLNIAIDFRGSKEHKNIIIDQNVFDGGGNRTIDATPSFEVVGITIINNSFLNNKSGERIIFNNVVTASRGGLVANNIMSGNSDNHYKHTDTLAFNNVVDGELRDIPSDV